MKELIKSILSYGSASPHFREFYSICTNMAMAHLSLTKNKHIIKELQMKLGITLIDLAKDCISDLFETEENSFIHINKYLNKTVGEKLDKTNDDEIKACLAILIKSKTNQQLSELRESFGEVYFKIRKAVSVYLARNKFNYNKIQYNDSLFLSNCTPEELNFELPGLDSEFLLQELYKIKFLNYEIPKVIREVFKIIYEQNEFCKAIKHDVLLKTLKIFYKSRMDDHQLGNVEYY